MIAAIATIAFLAAAWAAIVAIAGSLEQELGKIRSAIRGDGAHLVPAPIGGRVSQRYSPARVQRARARPLLRAAA